MSLRNLKTIQVKVHTAAQLIVMGYSEEQVAGDFNEEELAMLSDMVAALQFRKRKEEFPAAVKMGTTDWLKRRIELGITSQNSSKWREYLSIKHQLSETVVSKPVQLETGDSLLTSLAKKLLGV